MFCDWINKLLPHICLRFICKYKRPDRDNFIWALKPSYEMIPINFRCNRKSYSAVPNSRRDSAKYSSEVGHNFSKANFHTQVTCNSLNCPKKIILITKKYGKYG